MNAIDPSLDHGAHTERLERELARVGFAGDFERALGARLVSSTDNSIYQVVPWAIAYPRETADIRKLVRAAVEGSYTVSLTARGGNTGTNGQSLNTGVVVDFARHMRAIRHFDPASGVVTVEPGVVLDQLNAFLAPHGLFFPPMVSTANRATIGGMVATDASGKGSRRYGKTSDYVLGLDLVLSDGTEWRAEPMPRADAERLAGGTGLVAAIHREALRIVDERGHLIEDVFPKMNRGLTGYNLQKIYDADEDRFFLGPLLAGSEGTLALTRAITLRTASKPEVTALAVVRYSSFGDALRDVSRLIESDPIAVEILDDKVLGVAQTDVVWKKIQHLLGHLSETTVRAMNFVEFSGTDDASVANGLSKLEILLDEPNPAIVDHFIARDPETVRQLWTLREKSVGLLARLGGGRQGTPFVEDTAVPPEHLADYVCEFRAILDRRGLQYGMFGHADVGCLHVRPFLDMRDPAQAELIRPISDEVAQLTKAYGGLLWGEHGRGYRGEYSPLFFGALYPDLERLKRAFDPNNLFNPGKLAAPDSSAGIDRIDAIPLRGEADRKINLDLTNEFDRSIACNGNGACFSWDASDAMCPSYKATRDRAQSPKGRASLLRAWARAASEPQVPQELAELEEATARSLDTCLACKACTTMCPVRVDIPTMKSRFLERLYEKRRRPAKHLVLSNLELCLAVGRRAPRTINALLHNPVTRAIMTHGLGVVDIPRFSVPGRKQRPPTATIDNIRSMAQDQLPRTVVVVEDTFTASFDGDVVQAAWDVLTKCNYSVLRLPARANGKILHLLGRRRLFARIAQKRMRECQELSATGVKLVGLDAATSLMFSHEFVEMTGESVEIMGLEQLLSGELGIGDALRSDVPQGRYQVFGHCTENALRPNATAQWAQVLHRFGIEANGVRTGCCGMAGMFGHDRANQTMSRKLFDLSWSPAMQFSSEHVLATGFSCRSQTKRFRGFRPRHPIQLLRDILNGNRGS